MKILFKKIIIIIICICVISTTFNNNFIFASEYKTIVDKNTINLCEHHINHTEICGYRESIKGQPCNHQHDENCGGYILNELLCEHKHNEECEYINDIECEHKHDNLCGAIISNEENCTHKHDEICGYVEEIEEHDCEFICTICEFTICDWIWVDPYEILLKGSDYGLEDVSWVIGLPELEDDDLLTLLPSSIIATLKNGDAIELSITWNLENKQKYNNVAIENTNTYFLKAQISSDYVFEKDIEEPIVLIQIMSISPLWQPLPEQPSKEEISNSLHFYIRHWHSQETQGTFDNGNVLGSENTERYFIVIEGYITPSQETGDFKFYVNLQNDTIYKEGENEIVIPQGDLVQITSKDDSPYIKEIDFKTGSITLQSNPVKDENGIEVESFSTFSISAGHKAVTYNDDTITITYDKYIHLVKGHVFYLDVAEYNQGSDDEDVFGDNKTSNGITEDIAYVYVDENNSIIKDESGNPIIDLSNVNGQATLTKVYSTKEGLHTNKTANVVDDDNRIFNIELESWYSEGDIPQIGMILDASGSMAFASDTPSPIILDNNLIDSLGIHTLPNVTNQSGNPIEGWDYYFLTNKQIDAILDKHNTDNSQLSESGYNYFVYQDTENTQEYAPITYWDGSPIKNNYEFVKDEQNSITKLVVDDDKGYQVSGVNASSTPILLDAMPTSGNFTISFDLTIDGSDNKTNIAELLYIGPLNGLADSSGYYRLFRDQGTSSYRLRGNQNQERKFYVTDINNVFSKGTKRITIVFDNVDNENGTITSYLNSSIGSGSNGTTNKTNENEPIFTPFQIENIGDIRIVLNGMIDSYSGVNLYIDNFYVFNKVLSQEEIKYLNENDSFNDNTNLIGMYTFDSSNPLKNNINDNNATTLVEQILITYNGAMTQTIAKTANEENIIGIMNTSRPSLTPTYGHIKNDWYFLSHGSWDLYTYDELYSAKTIYGISGTINENSFSFSDNIVVLPDNANVPMGGTGYQYKPNSDTPIRFYVDHQGYLRCFYMGGDDFKKETNLKCSYVYEITDIEYIKLEALQRALGQFVTNLKNISPESQVAATRFHSNGVPDDEIYRLVLLDWTNDASKSAKIMSLLHDGTIGYDESENGIKQFNYGLTGSTSTWRGLKAFTSILNPSQITSKEKYLIIFTDGVDTDRDSNDSNKAKEITDTLKKDGWTIFTIMLNGGPIKEGGTQYQKAYDFLLSLSGNNNLDTNPEDYFFSIDKVKKEFNEEDLLNMHDSDILTSIFADKILSKMASSLEDYNVKDYIDPRFNLIDVNGNIWYLNANGKVTYINKNNEKITQDLKIENKLVVNISKSSSVNAQSPYLKYDEDKDMYYLEWINQTIPSSSIGASELKIWNAKFTLKAKDDFIGGNAILTNGNEANMNYVYHPSDIDISSGVDDMYIEENDNYPSKGFPRVVVNVKSSNDKFVYEDTIFMGEELSFKNVITKLVQNISNDALYSNNIFAKYAFDYIDRYSYKYKDMNIDDLASLFIENNNHRIIIPYSYILNIDESNQTGGNKHESDITGWIEYQIMPISKSWDDLIDEDNDTTFFDTNNQKDVKTLESYKEKYGKLSMFPNDGITKDTNSKALHIIVTFHALPLEGKINWNDEEIKQNEFIIPSDIEVYDNRIESNENPRFIIDNNYHWNDSYKPANNIAFPYWDRYNNTSTGIKNVGLLQNKFLIQGLYLTKIISGEIQLQLKLNEKQTNILNGENILYVANLIRNNNEIGVLTINGNITNGILLYNSIFEPKENYMGYIENNQYGLPFGTYTLKPIVEQCRAPIGYKFKDIYIVSNIDDYMPNKFIKGTNYEEANNYIGFINITNNEVTIGDKELIDTTTINSYLNYRFGLFYVEIEKLNSLTLSKTINGNMGNLNEEFEFIVTLNDKNNNTISGTYPCSYGNVDLLETITFIDGVATIKLKHNELITINNLPYGVTYTIKETNKEYTMTYQVNNGQIQKSKNKTITHQPNDGDDTTINCINTLNGSIPTNETTGYLWIALLILGLIPILIKFIIKNKNLKR